MKYCIYVFLEDGLNVFISRYLEKQISRIYSLRILNYIVPYSKLMALKSVSANLHNFAKPIC